MADIVVTRSNLPFVLGGTTAFTVELGAANPNQPLPRDTQVVLAVETQASANQPVTLGGAGSWTLGLKTRANVELRAVWQTDAALIRKYGLQPYFVIDPHGVVLLFTVGTSADGSFAGKFRYGALTAGATFEAGGDLSFTYARPGDPAAPMAALIPDFFSHVGLPATLTAAPPPGEFVHFEYGGYLQLGGSVGVGYEMKGTPALDIGQLHLAEHYQLSLVASAGLSAQVGGFFGIDIRADLDAQGRPRPGWARVVVNRTRASEFTFAADVSVTAKTKPQNLPKTPSEFLGSLVGVNVKNWLNLLQHVEEATDWNQTLTELDDLSIDFLTGWFGQTPAGATLPAFLAKVKQVVAEYDQVDTTVLTAVDHFFDKISGPGLGNDVAQGLESLAHLPSWDALRGDVDPTLWGLVNELTDGDPLGWIAEKAVGALQKRAQAVLDLGRAAATNELKAFITYAKGEFGLDTLVEGLRAIDTPAKLQAALKKRSGAFLERLLGPEIKTISQTQFGAVVTTLHDVLARIETFEQQAYDALTQALAQSLSFDLHLGYSRASDREALVDVAINTSTPEGQALLHAAALGDFTQALAAYRPDLVRLYAGTLTTNLVKTRTIGVNVVGWHDGWHYQSVEKVLLHGEQQIVPNEAGGVTVFSTIDLTKTTGQDRQRDRGKAQDKVRTYFLLRFLGESRGVVATDPAGQQYLIDTITQMAASYQLTFEDNHTTPKDLAYYLSFARDFGLVDAGLQPATIGQLLPQLAVNDYGNVSVQYVVRYTEDGLRRLFLQPPDDDAVRRIMREVILANFLAVGGDIAGEGWVYWTADVYTQWKQSPGAFDERPTLTYRPIDRSPYPDTRPAPPDVTLPADRHRYLGALYRIEDAFVGDFQTLAKLIAAGRISPIAFQQALGGVGDTLQAIDDFGESVNTTFALFDALLLQAGAKRQSALTLTSSAAGRRVKKVFVAA
ncbi:MAG: hypothetical protein KGN76_04720 [Acidobacteriota bacterium]|nr:hypothetical protein [Acidobacteriota bacterium]